MNKKMNNGCLCLRRAVATKAPLRVQFLLTFLGGIGGRARSFGFTNKKEGGGRGL